MTTKYRTAVWVPPLWIGYYDGSADGEEEGAV